MVSAGLIKLLLATFFFQATAKLLAQTHTTATAKATVTAKLPAQAHASAPASAHALATAQLPTHASAHASAPASAEISPFWGTWLAYKVPPPRKRHSRLPDAWFWSPSSTVNYPASGCRVCFAIGVADTQVNTCQ